MGPTVIRHACYRCGGSCQGEGARVEPAEVEALTALAAQLGRPDAVVDGRTRTAGGRCVLLTEDNLCAAELAGGPSAKPASCRSWPVIRAPDGSVLGVDPGCLTAFVSARSGPPVGEVDPGRSPHPSVRDALDGTLAQAMARLAGEAAAVGRPPPSERDWLVRRVDALVDVLLDPGRPPGLRARLRHLAGLRGRGDPGWPSAPEVDAQALSVARAMVDLDRVPGRAPERVARDALRGAALCAWADPDLARFGPALAAWSRAQREPDLLAVLDLP